MDQTPETTTDERAAYREAVRQLLRDRLLDAGREQLRGRAWAQVTMAEIATAAGVSRQTLYNEFGTRDEFGQALVIRESSRLLDAVEQTIAAHPEDPLAALTAGLERFLTIATTDPFVRLLLGDERHGRPPAARHHAEPAGPRLGERTCRCHDSCAVAAGSRCGSGGTRRHACAARDQPCDRAARPAGEDRGGDHRPARAVDRAHARGGGSKLTCRGSADILFEAGVGSSNNSADEYAGVVAWHMSVQLDRGRMSSRRLRAGEGHGHDACTR